MGIDAGESGGTFLAADVGGTHARIARVRPGAAGEPAVLVLEQQTFACADFTGLAPVLAAFRAGDAARRTRAVVVACAGTVVDGRVLNPNLAWPVDVAEVQRALDLDELAFLNDFEAVAHAAQCMQPDRTRLLTPDVSAAAPGPVLVLGPGTGLGAALRVRHRDETLVLPTEAGHTAFAPGTEREIAILRWLQRRARHVATENVLSGPGLLNIHRALCAIDGVAPAGHTPAEVTAAAQAGDARAREAVLCFCAVLGSVTGDLCLASRAGEVYIAGGMVPRLREFLPGSDFLARLRDKGGMSGLVERVPVRLIEDPQLGVIGAASWYLQQPAAR